MSTGRQFRIVEEIAEGSFGKVFLAELMSADGFSRLVALKLLQAKWSSHDEVVQRTRDEARLLGLLRHQHIVKVEDLTSIDGKCALVMEYLEGVDLRFLTDFLVERGVEFPRTALFEVGRAVASALDAAYNFEPPRGGGALQVIHRDIKPSNVFLTAEGDVKVLDFGTARANFAGREAVTRTLAFGSEGYMAPERMLGQEDTPAADVFSLGITLWEMLAQEPYGSVPMRRSKFDEKLKRQVARLPLDGSASFNEEVRTLVGSMLRYAPKERPSAVHVRDELERLAAGIRDGELRTFARIWVTEAREALPPSNSSDPLLGLVVNEDSLEGAKPAPPPPPPPPEALPKGLSDTVTPMSAPSAPSIKPPPVSSPAPSRPVPRAALESAKPKGGSPVVWLVLGAGVILLGMGLVVGVIGLAILVFVATSSGG